ncbi:hypothetical protein D9M68_683830 [compost metagenome]
MMTQSSWLIRWLAERAPTTAGMSMLRATMAVWLVLPPTSVTKPANTLCLNCSMSAGERSCAMSTSGTSTALSCPGRGWPTPTGDVTPRITRRMRPTTCSRSALRSRK